MHSYIYIYSFKLLLLLDLQRFYLPLLSPFRAPFEPLCPALFRKLLIKHGLHGGALGERVYCAGPAMEAPPRGQPRAVLFLVAPEHRVRGYLLWESLESQVGTCPTLPKKPKFLKAGTFSTPRHRHH